jgi:DNA-3-methyladenine glycosylase I
MLPRVPRRREYGAPKQITPKAPGDYLEVISKAAFQAGISWDVIEAKWDGIRVAFHEFDARKVAAMTPDDVDVLMDDKRVIRNRKKIEATIDNALAVLELDEEHGSFDAYLDSLGDFEAQVKRLRKDFRFLGDFGAYYFLYVVGKDVPPHEEFRASRAKK